MAEKKIPQHYADMPLAYFKKLIVNGAIDEALAKAEGLNDKQIADLAELLSAAGLFEVAAAEAAKLAPAEPKESKGKVKKK